MSYRGGGRDRRRSDSRRGSRRHRSQSRDGGRGFDVYRCRDDDDWDDERSRSRGGHDSSYRGWTAHDEYEDRSRGRRRRETRGNHDGRRRDSRRYGREEHRGDRRGGGRRGGDPFNGPELGAGAVLGSGYERIGDPVADPGAHAEWSGRAGVRDVRSDDPDLQREVLVCRRPNVAGGGRTLSLEVNCVRLELVSPPREIFHYRVDVERTMETPPQEQRPLPRSLVRDVINAALLQYPTEFHGIHVVPAERAEGAARAGRTAALAGDQAGQGRRVLRRDQARGGHGTGSAEPVHRSRQREEPQSPDLRQRLPQDQHEVGGQELDPAGAIAAGMGLRPSIAAVVASIDSYSAQYASRVAAQKASSDIHHLPRLLCELFLAFFARTKRKPERVVYYRNGVSGDQFVTVLQAEMRALRKAFKMISGDYDPPVTFVMANKRHHLRAFALDGRDADRKGNLLPGTVVDTGIVDPHRFDFYLYGHSGIQGTTVPAHYTALHDDNHLSAEDIQRLTYHLGYTYARCTRSVSLVTPAYYAHRAAARARCFLTGGVGDSSDVGTSLSSRMEQSDSGSTESTDASFAGTFEFKEVHPNLVDRMFFL